MKKLIDYCLNNSFKVNIISLFIFLVGLWSVYQLNITFLPNTEQPHFFFIVRNYNLGIYEMDSEIAAPISEKILSLEGVKSLTTKVLPKRSTYFLELAPSKSIKELEEEILNFMGEFYPLLPNGREDLTLGNPWSGIELGYFSASGIDLNNDSHRFWLKNSLIKLSKVQGVKSVNRDFDSKNIYIDLNLEKLSQYELRVANIKNLLKQRLKFQTLGYVQSNSKRMKIAFPKSIESIESLKSTVIVNQDGKTIILDDIANVYYQTFSNPRRKSLFKGKDLNLFRVEALKNINVLKSIDLVKEKISELQNKAPQGVELDLLYESDGFMRKQFKLLKNNAFIGIALLILLLGFLVGFRISFVVIWGLPIVYCLTFILMKLFDVQIDLMSVTGLIIVVGILVDDAMIVSEKYLDELESGLTPQQAIKTTISRTIFPITGAMLTTIIAFYPIAYDQNGNPGWFWGVFMIMLLSLIASWLETYFILPNHLVHFVSKKGTSLRSRILEKVRKAYEKVLRVMIKCRYIALAGFIIFSIWTFQKTFQGKSVKFGVSLNYPRIVMLIDFNKSYDFDKAYELLTPFVQKIESEMNAGMIGEYFVRLGGKRLNSGEVEGKEYAAIRMVIAPEVDNPKEKLQEVKKRLKDFWIKSQGTIQGVQNIDFRDDIANEQSQENEILLNLRGIEEDKLTELMKDLKEKFSQIPGIEDVFVPSSLFDESWVFYPNFQALSEYNISRQQIQAELNSFLSYQRIHRTYFKGERTSVEVGVENPIENDMSQRDDYFIMNQQGQKIPLKNLGVWKKEQTLKKIRRFDGLSKREVSILFDSKVTSREKLKSPLNKTLSDIKENYPKANMWFELESKQRKRSRAWIFQSFVICLLGIYFVLIMTLKSLFQPLLVMLAIPFGLVGIAWALHLHDFSWELMGIVGMIGMTGVVVNDSLLMIDSINYEKNRGKSFLEAILKGSSSRLRPIIVTSMTTLAGIFPTIYGFGGDAGYSKMLVFSLGWGILVATILILLILPAFVKIIDDLSFMKKLFQKRA